MFNNINNNNSLVIELSEPKITYSILGAHISYKVTTKTNLLLFNGNEFVVSREYDDFKWLNDELKNSYADVDLPPLPPLLFGFLCSDEFIENRRKSFEKYLATIGLHNELSTSDIFCAFLKKQDYKISTGFYIVKAIVKLTFNNFLKDQESLDKALLNESKRPKLDFPSKVSKQYNYSFIEDPICPSHIISTRNDNNLLLFYFHGGAYAFGLTDMNIKFVETIMNELKSCTVVIPDYPLLPNYKHKVMFDSIEEVYRKTISLYPNHKIVIFGDSAGGGMTFILAQRLALARRNSDPIRQPDSVLLLSPWLDVSMQSPLLSKFQKNDPILEIYGTKKLGEDLADGISTKDPRVSPLYGSLDNLPPVSVWTSSHDILVVDSRKLHERYVNENVKSVFRLYDEPFLLHCWFLIVDLVESKSTMKEIVKAIKEDCRLDVV